MSELTDRMDRLRSTAVKNDPVLTIWDVEQPDAALIVAAVNALPVLLDRVEAAERVAEAAERLNEIHRYQTNGQVPPDFRPLDKALAAWRQR